VNATSAATVVTLTNNQTVPLTIAGISTTGNFAQTSTCPLSPNTLAAGANCAISVTFTPSALGTLTGTLTVSDNASTSPQTVQLSGTGTAPVTLSNATLSFVSQIVTTTSAGKSVTLKNNQTVPLTIATISTTGNFGQTSTCPSSPATLAAGASCVISVTFTPTAVGSLTGTLIIAESANTSPLTVTMAGTGTLSGLLSISLAPISPTLSPGAQQQFVATGMWTGGVAVNINQFVTWSSSAPSVAPVNSNGLVQAAAQGSAVITASYGSVTQSAAVTVAIPTVNAVTVTPNAPTVPQGAYQQFTAVLSYTDGSTKNATGEVSWSSSAPAVATVSGSGLVSALAAGSTNITATAESITGSSTLGVSQLPCVSAPPGLVGWWTGDGNTVDIAGDNSGSLQNGATYGNGEVAQAFSFGGNSASVLVNSPVYSPAAGTLMFWFLPTGAGALTGSFDGTNRTPGVSIDASGNLNWEFGNLSAQVLGQVSSNQWSHLALTYSTSNNEVAVNVYLNGSLAASAISSQNSAWYPQLAIGAYLGVVQKPSFTGSMDEVAIFNQALNAQQIQQIYDAFGAGMCKPTLQSIALTPLSPSIAVGLSQQFDAVGSYSNGSTHDLTTSAAWSSSNPPVAILNGSGQATAVAVGNATITAALSGDTGSSNLIVVPGLVSVQVNPTNPAIAVGTTQAFTATGTFSDGSTQNLTASISWSSSPPSIATIAAGGLANGVAAGQATITATVGSVSSSTLLTVTPATLTAITVAPASPTIAAGTTQPFTATGLFSDGSTQVLTTSVSWGSSTPSVATINSAGLATGLAPGPTTITATLGSVVGNSAVLTVSTAVLTSITVNPANPYAPVGTTQQFTASGTFSDGSTQDVTGIVQWASSNTSVASTSNAAGSSGLTTCLATGSSSISATSGSITTSTTLTVSNATLVSITVNPPGPSIGLGTTQQFTAIGTFTDGSTQNLTASVTWSSLNPAVAAVNSNALGISLTTGTATITATLGGITGSALLTVTSASVVSITVSPSTTAIPSGLNQTFTAVGTFTDGSMQNVTNSAYWTSSVPGVATVSNTSGSNGMVSSTSSGSTVISATLGGVSGSGNLTVTSGILAAIEISPQGTSIPIGSSEQFTATGLYTDGSTANLTSSVTWASSSASVATIANSSGSQGMANSAGSGTTEISATFGSLAGSASLAVQDLLVSITVSPGNASIVPASTQQFAAIATYTSGLTNDVTGSVLWSSSSPAVATIAASGGLATGQAIGQTVITASLASIGGSVNLAVASTPVPTSFRVDISDGTTGQLFVSWDTMNGASYYNLQRSTSPTSGYSKVTACSGLANLKTTETISVMQACRNNGLTVGTTYYYEVQACYSTGCSSFSAPASNVPVTSNCTAAQIPSMVAVTTLPAVALVSSTVDPNIQFLPSNYQYAYYASPGVPRRNLLFVDLPGSDETCPAASALNNTAEKLGFDVICVNYSNLSAQDNICVGNIACFGNVSQAKENATGICSTPGQSQCGIDPHTGQPYYLNNPSDAVTQRISMMLQYLNTNGYNQNGTNWGSYLSGTTPLWQNIILGGHSQGGDMATFTAYQQVVARAINLSGPPQATLVNNVEVGATYFSNPMATSIRDVYGLVSVDDSLYQDGVFAAVWQVLGFTAANNDAEVKLNTSTPIGLNCNSGAPSHNFSTSAPVGPDGDGHDVPLYLWNEDIYKFMLID
jgi:trimeric autotransporter adhesin